MAKQYTEIDISEIMVTLNTFFSLNHPRFKPDGHLALFQLGTTVLLQIQLNEWTSPQNCRELIGELKTIDIYRRERFSRPYMFLVIGNTIQCVYRIPSMTLRVFVQIAD
jgi:hypothetical protein